MAKHDNNLEFCGICRDPLERRDDDRGEMCPSCAEVVSGFLDDTGLGDGRVEDVIRLVRRMIRRACRKHLKLRVPTYYGQAYADAVLDGVLAEFGKPFVPLLARRAEGLRIVLGSHDFWDCEVPDIQIERRPNGWAIFLHPLGGSDASGYVFFLDDGRSFVVPEQGATPPIEVREWDTVIAEVDRGKRR